MARKRFLSSGVRTATADPTPTQVDVKKQDPFLYYSIPGVHDAALRHEHVQVAQNGLKTKLQVQVSPTPR